MIDDHIREVTQLMVEQAEDYATLDHACAELCDAMINAELTAIESQTIDGGTTLFRMRARLVRIIRALTDFAAARASSQNSTLAPETRSAFEAASIDLLNSAKQFQRTHARAAALTTGGATFATACIEVCGIQPSTYKAPYTRNGEVRPWA
ncbi:MAG TPA: hypothetical protein VFI24_08380 [Pyrinomonadaceae bacterium]|nr:hypothetical protein [Pyrinomonadaceae bacterium]